MSKPTVLIVHNRYRIPGGEDTVAENEKELLESNGHKVVSYIRDNNETDEMNLFQKMDAARSFVYSNKTYREIKSIIERESVDIVQVHNTMSFITPSVYYAATDMGIPVIQTVHNFRLFCPGALLFRNGHICEECIQDDTMKCALHHNCYRNSRWFTRLCVYTDRYHRKKGIYNKINYICLTEFNRLKLLEGMRSYVDPDKVYVKPNFVNDSFSGMKNSEDTRYGRYFLFAGRLEPEKGLALILEEWQKNGRTEKLIIAGSGSMEKQAEQIQKSNGNVIYLGQLSHNEVLKLMHGAQALLAPSEWYEGFPMNIIESFMCATPVVCRDIGNTADIVGRITPEMLITEKRSLGDILNSFDKSRYSRKCREAYEIYYTPEVNYKKFIEIIQNVTEKGKNA